MQERYLGDSHDFLKYALLRHLSRNLRFQIGVNWYLTRPEDVDAVGNGDGEKRHHLTAKGWCEMDHELFDLIGRFENPAARKLHLVEEWGILPEGTAYYSDIVSAQRKGWFDESLSVLGGTNLIFLDPDNGFEVKSMTKRTAPKYALYEEAAAYSALGKIVVSIQFARQCDPVQRAHETRQRLAAASSNNRVLPVLRGRVAPNILFLTLAPEEMHDTVADALKSFAEKSNRVEIID